METYDVIISGYGPVSQVIGNILGRSGVPTLIVDRLLEVVDIPRAIHFDDEVMRIFQSLGLDREIAADVECNGAYRLLNARGDLLFQKKLETGRTANGHAEAHFFYQPELEAHLRKGVRRFDSVTVRVGHELSSYRTDESLVTAEIRDLGTDTRYTARARYLLGCDGSRSLVRKTMGYGLRDYKFDQPWLVVDCEETGPTRFPKDPHQICDPQRTFSLIPSRRAHRRWEIYLKPDDDPEEINRPERIYKLIAPWAGPAAIRIIRSSVYRFHALIARRWRDRRVLLAGDAAHQMPPFLGQGMCSGIRDAHNLAWKLSLVLRRGATPDLLDTYQQERRPHLEFITRKAMLSGRIIQARGLKARLRDMLFNLLGKLPAAREKFVQWNSTWPRLKAGFFLKMPGEKSRLPEGRLFPQALVECRGSVDLLDNFSGHGFAVLSRSHAELIQVRDMDPNFWALLDTRFVQIVDPEARIGPRGEDDLITVVQDQDGILRRWFDNHRAKTVIIRPDRHVFGIDPDARQIAKARRYLFSAGPTPVESEKKLLKNSKVTRYANEN